MIASQTFPECSVPLAPIPRPGCNPDQTEVNATCESNPHAAGSRKDKNNERDANGDGPAGRGASDGKRMR